MESRGVGSGRRPSLHRYRFRSVWMIAAPSGDVFEVLARAEEYPGWWPQVREVRRIDTSSGTAAFRSVLPYTLRVGAREARNDRTAGVLQIDLSGDLEGWARFTVVPGGARTRVVFEQEVVVHKRLLRWLAVPARPLLRANHAWMMRGGRRGLRDRV
ncbi:polyketide cyclase [Streptomyces sp. A7024]|uniref:Polyketide cyclase n=1 Tax=Streptomyces coryli TaxID=1128680 RepID=A0A6G4U0L4_9ACTN|nr:SRPBCC family protein [Streptomyces coryli]NGN65775.1 polyketide cyclase [Streptomyces coryli]